MDWVKEFYTAQNEWFGVYLVEIEENHRERAILINSMTDSKPKKILELGAGGGQTSIALSELGHEVSMIELLEDSVEHAHLLAEERGVEIEILHGDFYEVNIEKKFDLVCYFDSFGIGEDDDQIQLLKRIKSWLNPNGCAIIEIGATWYWGGIAKGKIVDLGACYRQYDFDALGSRLIDSWWRKKDPETIVKQSLRCYTPMDLRLLLKETGLEITELQAGGSVDYDRMEFVKKTKLEDAMTYYIKLELTK